MNTVELRYTYLSKTAELNINGEKISPYSDLSRIMNRSFIESSSLIIQGLDKEIFDDYELDIYSKEFQYEVIRHFAQRSEYCKSVHFHIIDSLLSEKELLERLSYIGEHHNISVSTEQVIKIYSEVADIKFPEMEYMRVEEPVADIGIFATDANVPLTIKIPIILSDYLYIKEESGRYFLYVPQRRLDLLWDYYRWEFVLLPEISEYITALKYAKLAEPYKTEIEAYKLNKPMFYLSEIVSSMDQGISQPVSFLSIPNGHFELESDQPLIMEIKDGYITALTAGVAHLCVKDKSGEIITSKSINVIAHQYAEEIKLIPRFEYLKQNERNRIDVIVTPPNAEDANKLLWEISDPNVIQLDESGNVIALSYGKATITVTGKKAVSTVVIEVKPSLQSLRFTQQAIRLKNGEMTVLECEINPTNAPTENLVWELDNRSIASINPSKTGKRCQIIASKSYEGKGNVKCYDPISRLGAICNIEVITRVQQTLAGKLALWCWLIGIIIPFLLPISTIAGIYGLACDSEPEHRTRYIVCTIGSVLTLLFWVSIGMG